MPRKNNHAGIAKLAASAIRAASLGGHTGLALEASLHARRIIAIIITMVIGVLLFFTNFVYAAAKEIPGFEMLYKICKSIGSEPNVTAATDNIQTELSDSTMPVQTIGGGQQ